MMTDSRGANAEKRAKCDICGLSFSTFFALKRHQDSHRNEFVVNETGPKGKSFSSNDALMASSFIVKKPVKSSKRRKNADKSGNHPKFFGLDVDDEELDANLKPGSKMGLKSKSPGSRSSSVKRSRLEPVYQQSETSGSQFSSFDNVHSFVGDGPKPRNVGRDSKSTGTQRARKGRPKSVSTDPDSPQIKIRAGMSMNLADGRRLSEPAALASKQKLKQCESCDYSSRYNIGLYQHVRKHHTDVAKCRRDNKGTGQASGQEQCRFCGFTCKYKSVLRRHVEAKHRDEGAEVPDGRRDRESCDFPVKSEQEAELLAAAAGSYRCGQCDFSTSRTASLNSHVLAKHEDGEANAQLSGDEQSGKVDQDEDWQHEETVVCQLCTYKTTVRALFYRHVAERHGTNRERSACNVCDFQTLNRFEMRIHMARQHGKHFDLFACDVCDYGARCRASVERHIISRHSIIPLVECGLCPKKFRGRDRLDNHVRNVHASALRRFQCDMCPFATKYAENYRRHMIYVHEGDVSVIPCDKCDHVSLTVEQAVKHKLKMHKSALSRSADELGTPRLTEDSKSPFVESKAGESNTGPAPLACCFCDFSVRTVGEQKKHVAMQHAAEIFAMSSQEIERGAQELGRNNK